MLQDYTPGTPDSWQELLIYVLTGAVPVLFGLLRKKQNKNTKEIENLKTEVRLNGYADADKEKYRQR